LTRDCGPAALAVRCPTSSLTIESETRLLAAFRRAASLVPAYRELLEEAGTDIDQVVDASSLFRLVPVLSKATTFGRFAPAQLSVGGVLPQLADVMTSSGHGGSFSFGMTTRAQTAANEHFLDLAFDAAFDVRSKPTLVVNCLPMGVVFSSQCMTVATTSVREDMAVALIREFGHCYEQVVLVGDPLFMKRLVDHAKEAGLDWRRYRVHAMLGEEVFGEHFRGYLAACLGLDPERPEGGYIMSSFGTGELGLHLCHETPATIALRRAAFQNPAFARDLFSPSGCDDGALPSIFTFDPRRILVEIINQDANGFGLMTVSMLDATRVLPLLRYRLGDIACLLDSTLIAQCADRHGMRLTGDLPAPLLALKGRDREALPNGSYVSVYKDALYADPQLADHLSGAMRVIFDGRHGTVHVQLAKSVAPTAVLTEHLHRVLPASSPSTRLVPWRYERFPFGMRLDYERKFSHFVPGESNPGTECD
jgi:phenylacetate-CoA ligase